MVLALAMTMLFAMPSGAFADGDVPTDGTDAAQTEQPADGTEEATSTADDSATAGEQAGEGEQPAGEGGEGEASADNDGTVDGEPSVEGEGDSPETTLLTDSTLGAIQLFSLGDGKTVVDPDTTDSWQNFTAPGGVTSTQNVGRIWTDKSVFNTDYALSGSDELNGKSISKGDSDFLVALSALSSTSNLKEMVKSGKPLDIVLVLDMSGSMDKNFGYGWNSQKKITALKTAVNSFIDATASANDELDASQRHEISIVKFAGTKSNKVGDDTYSDWPYTYNYSQVVTNLRSYTSQDANQLKSTVNNLEPAGGTQANYGMELAQSQLQSHGRDDAQQVVIFFTDGEPGDGDSFSTSVANGAVKAAQSLKDGGNGALIYTVGIFNGASSTNMNSQANQFMQAVSSNFPNASAYNNRGERAEGDYYKTASDASELNSIFEDIFEETQEGTASGSPIVDESEEGNTDPGDLTFTDQLGSYMQVSGDKMTLVFADGIYEGTINDDGTVTFPDKETTANTVYGSAKISDIKVTINKSSDLATGDTVNVTIPASLLPMRNYDVDTDAKSMSVTDAYPVRLFYGVSLKKDAKDALSNPTSDTYQAIIASQATEGTIDFYSNNFVKEQADGETTASFEPNAGNKFYYYTQDATLYIDENCRTEATNQNIGRYNTLYWKDTYWVQTANGGAEERSVGVAIQRDSAEWNAMAKEDGWNGAYYIPAGTQRSDRPATLASAKGENKTGTAKNVLNPSWNDNGTVTQALGNNGKLSFAKPGSLEIKKTVDWGNASDDTKTNHNSFSFDITATTPTGENGAAENLNGTYNYFVNGAQDPAGQVEFKDGKGTVTMNGGDTLVIEGLPAGASFTVDEQNANSNGFSTTDATSQADVDNTDPKDGSITGTIIAGSQVSLTFTNTYHASDVNLNTDTTLKVQKNLEGRDWRDGDSFDFTIDGFYAPTGVSEAPEPEDTTITVDASDKDAGYTASFGDITFSAPGEYRYTVQEVSDPKQPIAGIDYSDAIYRVTVMVGDSGTGALTIDSVKIERMNNDDGTVASTAEEGVAVDGDTMEFTNTYKADSATQGIQGKKSYTDTTDGNPFEAGKFTFKLEAQGGFKTNGGSADNPTITAADTPMPEGAENNAITTGNVGEEFTFPSITFDGNDVGNTYVYKVTEVEGDEADKGMTYSKAEHTVMIQVEEVTDDNGTHIKATVQGDYVDPSKLVFENEYKPTEAKLEGNSAIHGTKTLTGRDMQDGETYYFQLTAVDDNAKSVLPNAQTVKVTKDNMENGSAGFKFDDMSFTKVGTYTFAVNEVADENGTETTNGSGMTFDTNVATVKVTVSDTKNGSLKAEVSYSNDKHGETTDQALFTNVYEASINYGAQGKGGINVTKTMKDRPMTAGEFSFSIAGTNAEGSVSADEANQKLTDADTSFQNGAAKEDGTDTMAKLQNVSFDQDDAGKTFSYIVDETTESGAAQVSYDKSQYRVDIQVVDNGDGSMHTVTTVTQIKDANGNDMSTVVIDKANSDADGYTAPTFGFTNDYNPNPATVGEKASHQIQVKKTVTGADSATDYTFTLTATGDNIGNITGLDENNQLTVKTDGTIKAGESQTMTFGDLTFSEPGTYTFTVQENQPAEDAGWTFDTTARTVTVVVTDLNKEGKYDGNLYIASVTDDGLVEITNSYEAQPVIVGGDGAQQQITVQKSVTGKNPEGDFNFKIEPVYDDTYTEDVWKQNVEAASDDFDAQTTVSGVTTEQFQTASFAGIKFKATGEYKFKITEVEASAGNTPAGWTYDAHESFATVTVKDNGEGQLVATVSYDNTQATTDADKAVDNAVAFTNSYKPDETATTDDTSIDTNILVTKEVTGAPATEAFKFTLKLAEDQSNANVFEGTGDDKTPFDGVEVTTSDKLAAGATETKAFAGVTFTAPGDYKFVIDETTTTDKAGWTYDGSTHEITVHVADEDAKLVITSIEGNNPTFTNSYTPNEVTTDGQHGLDNLQVTKEVTGAPATEDFSFSLKLTSGDINNVKLGSGETEEAFPGDGINTSTTGLTDKEGDAAKQTVSFGDMSFTATGTYTFEVAETTTTDKDGWRYDNAAKTITVEVTDDNFDGQLDAKVTGDNPTITNNYTADSVTVGEGEASGPIQVTKNIEGTAPATEDFNFELAFDVDAEGNTGKAENIEGLNDGKLTATVSKDSLEDNTETVSFGDLTFKAEGKYYFTVTETTKAVENSGWTYDNTAKTVIVSVTDTDHDGYLEATVNDDAAAFTNSYKASPVSTEGEGAIGNLQVTKEVTGNSTNDAFSFTATLTSDNAANVLTDANDPTSTFSTDGITVSTEAGFSDGQTKAASFGNLTFTAEGDYTFKVVENDQAPVNWTYATGDDNAKTITIHVTDTDHDGKLEAAYDETNANNPTFTNTYKAEGELPGTSETEADLTVTKTIDGRSFQDGDAFTFTLTAGKNNPAGATLLDNAGNLQIAYAEGDDTATKSANFGNIKFTLPGTYTFYVSEQTPADADKLGGMTYSTEQYTVTVEVTDAADGNGKLDAHITSIVNKAGGDVTKSGMVFTNTYKTSGKLDSKGDEAIEVTKNLTGRVNNEWLDTDVFKAILTAQDSTVDGQTMAAENVPMPEGGTGGVATVDLTKDNHESVAFGDITYARPGTYNYTLTEVQENPIDGVYYSLAEYGVVVTATDNGDGTMTVTSEITQTKDDDGYAPSENGYTGSTEAVDVATFHNVYQPNFATLDGTQNLTVTKNLEGRDWYEGDEWTFTLALADGGASKVIMPAQTQLTINADTPNFAASFGNITFRAAGTYTFTVTESGAVQGVTNDADAERTIVVEVTDDTKGNLTAEVVKDKSEGLTFTNTYQPGSTTISGDSAITVQKTLTGRDWADGEEFGFTIKNTQKPDGMENAPMPENATITVGKPAEGNVATAQFGDMTFTQAGTYVYEITENAGDGSLSYDGHTATVTVAVFEDQATGMLSAQVSYDNSTATTDGDKTVTGAAAFTNAYSTEGFNLSLTGTKDLDGRDFQPGDEFTFTVNAGADVPVPDGVTVTTEDESSWTGTVTIKPESGNDADINFGTATIPKVGEYTYLITEQNTGIAGMVYDETTHTITFKVEDNGQGGFTVTQTAGDLTWVNTAKFEMDEPVSVQGTKTMTGAGMSNGQFTFKVDPQDGAPMGDGAQVVTNGEPAQNEDGSWTASFDVLKNVSYDAPGDYVYLVSEQNDGQPGFTYDGTQYRVTVTVAQDGSVSTKIEQSADGENWTEATAVAFNNSYATEGSATLNGSANLNGTKTLSGRDWKSDDSFTFILAAADEPTQQAIDDGTIHMPDTMEVVQGAFSEGAQVPFNFGDIVFDQAGTYKFTISEQQPGDDGFIGQTGGMTYDDHVRTITVTVADNGQGGLEATAQAEGYANWTNTYTAGGEEPGTLSGAKNLEVTKVIDGRDWQEGDSFTFTLTADENNPEGATLPENASGIIIDNETKDHKAAFGDITFTQPGNYTFYVNEQVPADEDKLGGMTYDDAQRVIEVSVQDEGDGTLSAVGTITSEKGLTFTNIYTYEGGWAADPTQTEAQLVKVLEGKAWTDDAFTFALTAKGGTTADGTMIRPENMPMPAGAENGELTTTVSEPTGKTESGADMAVFHFGTVEFDEPGTYTYEVTEVPGNNTGISYDNHTATITVSVWDNLSGQLEGSVSVDKGTFTNTYATTLYYSAKGGIDISKTVNGASQTAGEFGFVVTPADEASAALLGIDPQVGSVTVYTEDPAADGEKSVFSLTNNGEPICFTQADNGKTFAYTVKEVVPEGGVPAGYTYDPDEYTVTIAVSDDSQGKLQATTTVVSNGGGYSTSETVSNDTDVESAVEIPFVNTYSATGTLGGEGVASIVASKVLNGRPQVAGEFAFDVTNANGDVVATGSNDVDGAIDFSQIQYTIKDLNDDVLEGNATYNEEANSYTYTYTVAENIANLPAGVTDDKSANHFNVTVTVVDNGDGTLTPSVAYPQGYETGLVFVNNYTTIEGSVSATVKAHKTLENLGLTGRDFVFMLDGGNLANPMYKTNDANGDVAFTVNFTADDLADVAPVNGTRSKDFTYTVSELNTKHLGVTYDTATYQVTVTLTDTNGELSTKVSYGEGVDPEVGVTFTNTYTPAYGTGATINIDKTLTGRAMANGEFSFLVKDANGKVVAGAQSGAAASGEVSHMASTVIPFDQKTLVNEDGSVTPKRTFEYTVEEVQGNLGGVTYDKNIVSVQVIVRDDGDGTMSTEVVYPEGTNAAQFFNTYSVDEASFTPTGWKNTAAEEGAVLDGKTFSFVVNPVVDGVEDTANPAATGTSSANDAITFGEIKINGTGDFTYAIREVNGGAGGVTYDDSVYYLVLHVSDAGDGTYAVAHEYYDGNWNPVADDGVVFNNSYVGKDTSIKLSATKELDGRALKDGEFNFYVFDAETGQLVSGGTNKANGDVTFGEIGYEYSVEDVPATEPEQGETEDQPEETTEPVEGVEGTEGTDTDQTGDTTEPVTPDQQPTQGGDDQSATPVDPAEGSDQQPAEGEGSVPEQSTDEQTPGEGGSVAEEPAPQAPAESTTEPAPEEQPAPDAVAEDAGDPMVAALSDLLAPTTAVADDTDAEQFVSDAPVISDASAVDAAAAPAEEVVTDDAAVVDETAAGQAADQQPAIKQLRSTDLGDHWYRIVEHIPYGAHYDEATGEYTLHGVTYDQSYYLVCVNVFDNGDGTMGAAVTKIVHVDKYGNQTGVTLAGADGMDNVVFRNTYKVSGETSVTLEGTKTLTGRAMAEDEFGFTVTNDATGKVEATGSNAAAEGDTAAIKFGQLTYDKAGEYDYTVAEVFDRIEVAGVTYDPTTFKVHVSVMDNGQGGLTAEVTYPEGGISFKNDYGISEGTSVVLEASKTLTGRAMAEGEFGFTVTDGSTGEVVAAGSNAAADDGEAAAVEFSAIQYAEPGEHDYVVAEVAGNAGGVTYDGRTFDVHVSVTDNGDGTLGTDVTYPEGGIAFVNGYGTVEGASVTVTPEASKTLTGRDMVDGEFAFTVTDSATGNVVARGTNAADGTVAFDAISLTAKGDYEFVITEVNGRQSGVTYDDAAYRMLVTVSDDGEGGLVAEVDYPDGLPRFANSYEEPAQPSSPGTTGPGGEPNGQVPKTSDDGNGLAGAAALGLGGLGAVALGGAALLRRRASRR